MPHFPFFHQLSHRSDRLFNGRSRIDAMQVVEIDEIDPKSTQAAFAGLPNVVRLAVHTAEAGIRGIAHDAELCRQSDLVPAAANGLTNQNLIRVGTVCIRRVQKSHAEIDRALNGRGRLLVIAPAVKVRHAHAAEAEGGDGEAGTSKLTALHVWLLKRR